MGFGSYPDGASVGLKYLPTSEPQIQDFHVGKYTMSMWWQLKYVFFSHLPTEMIQFDEHIFQMG